MKWWILLLAIGLLAVSAKTKDTDGDGISDECKLHVTMFMIYNNTFLWNYLTKTLTINFKANFYLRSFPMLALKAIHPTPAFPDDDYLCKLTKS